MITLAPNPVLKKLHDFYQPSQPSWKPQTIGWYILFAVITLFLFWFAIRIIRSWFRNRYRREALRELVTATPDQFSALLKRTALCAWPREEVASLSGDAWLSFLGKTIKHNLFRDAPGNLIEEIALQEKVPTEDERTLRALAAEWIRSHRVQA